MDTCRCQGSTADDYLQRQVYSGAGNWHRIARRLTRNVQRKVFDNPRDMMKLPTAMFFLLFAALCFAGCGKEWGLEYGDAQAQFNEDAVLEKAKPFVGKQITVKGVVTKQDLSDPENCMIYLSHSIRCNLGDMQSMAESYTVGKTVFITGSLVCCEDDDILLEPAVGTDPNVEFNPVE